MRAKICTGILLGYITLGACSDDPTAPKVDGTDAPRAATSLAVGTEHSCALDEAGKA